MEKTKKPEQSQRERFESAARELGCAESEERFDAVLKKVAKHRPAPAKDSDQPAQPPRSE